MAFLNYPPTIKVGTKNGAVNQSRSEVVLVHAPHGEYVYCIMTKKPAGSILGTYQRRSYAFAQRWRPALAVF